MDISGQATRRRIHTILGRVDGRPADDAPRIRISDADRERAAQRLHEAMAEGRITLLELEDRLGVVYAARYEADLAPPLADLPDGALVRAASAAADECVVLRATGSGLKRSGAWEVPSRLRVQCPVGSVVLDFCDAVLPRAVVDIEIHASAGSVKLLVPDGATANVDGLSAGWGSVTCALPTAPRPGAPHFVVHGRSWLGSVTVRRRRRFAGHTF